MIKLVFVIISLFIAGLIINQLIKCFSPKIIEGATGSSDKDSSSCSKDPLQMAMDNSAQIKTLKEQMSKVTDLTNQYDAMNKQVESNSYMINKINQQIADQAKNVPDSKTQEKLANSGNGSTESR